LTLLGRSDATLVDLRERREREKRPHPGSLHAHPDLADNVRQGGMLHELASATGKRLVFLGLRRALGHGGAGGPSAGIAGACHIERHRRLEEAGGPTVAPGS
jgi:hypothetical protein